MSLVVSAAALGGVAAGLAGLAAWSAAERAADAEAHKRLGPSADPRARFDPSMLEGLPEPARRYFRFAIQPGAPLATTADIEMTGELSLASKEKPNFLPMRASQTLRIDGFVWSLRAGTPWLWFSGSDGYADGRGWTRFRLYGLLPVVRAGGDGDFARSAAGRAIAEAVFWVPPALLPSDAVRWEAVDADTARAIVRVGGHEHRLELTVGEDGRPRSVSILRWSRENAERRWRLQPFGGTIEAIREVDGYRVAAEVEGGNWFGTPDYFPFYRARVTDIQLR